MGQPSTIIFSDDESAVYFRDEWFSIAYDPEPEILQHLEQIKSPMEQLVELDRIASWSGAQFRSMVQQEVPFIQSDTPVREWAIAELALTDHSHDIDLIAKSIRGRRYDTLAAECISLPRLTAIALLTQELRTMEDFLQSSGKEETVQGMATMLFQADRKQSYLSAFYRQVLRLRENYLTHLRPADAAIREEPELPYDPWRRHTSYMDVARAAYVLGKHQVISDIGELKTLIALEDELHPGHVGGGEAGYKTWYNVLRLGRDFSGGHNKAEHSNADGFRRLVFDLISGRLEPQRGKPKRGKR